ncbi:MAG: hypothetical protein K0Q73_9042 [Paenibacillus sp.]|jgi:hypothetical protein|nr:hypothetical protein [Paenibacillus sp.]
MAVAPAPYVKNPQIDFTRKKKLPFETVMQLLISMGGNSLYKELLELQGVNTFVMHDVGEYPTFQGKGTITELNTYKLEKPDLYEVSATAKFMIGEGDNKKDFEVKQTRRI